MNLIILKPEDLSDEGLAELTDGRAKHIRSVLKAEPGQSVRIGMLNGPVGRGTVIGTGKDRVCLECAFTGEMPQRPAIDLLLAMPRPKVMKRLWAQLAALGLGRIVIVNASKVERFYFDSHVLEPEYYTKLLIEGLQQACCTQLPEVMIRERFKPFVEDELDDLFGDHLKLLADPSGERRISDFEPAGWRTVLAVGPEGGWIPYELEMLQKYGFELFGMGRRILRTDTACIALLSTLAENLNHG
jgi:RsmE family RNA methyltransferase